MPKETIKRPEPSPTPNAEDRLGLTVGWNPTGWVQVYMEPHDAAPTGDWHIVDLDRSEINRAIRALRKARDRAFGTDA